MKDKVSTDEVQTFLREIKSISNLVQRRMLEYTSDYDLTPEECHLLGMISHEDGLTQKDVADRLKITPATLSVRITRLEENGFVIRKRDEEDKRKIVLSLAKKGQEKIETASQTMEGVILKLFEDFSKEDFDILDVYLKRMKNNIKKGD